MKYNNLYVELISAGCEIIRKGATIIFGIAPKLVIHGQFQGMAAMRYRRVLNRKLGK